MRMPTYLTIPVLTACLTAGVYGQATTEPAPPPPPQANAGSPCPKIEVQGQSARSIREGQPVTFVASIQGGDPKAMPQIIWSVRGGAIRDGQQTRKIEVDSTGAGMYREIVADVWIGGYPPECLTQASGGVRVIPPAMKVDEFGELESATEIEKLSNLASTLGQSDDRLYVFVYSGRTSERGYASNALKRIRTNLINSGLEENRIGLMDGGFRENPAYEVWVVPQGAESPKPSPTVDRREIVNPRITPPARKPGRPTKP